MAEPPRIREGSDRALRRLFSHPEVAADLLRGFVPVPALAGFDPGSLRPLPDDRVDPKLNRRQSDATWIFSLEGGARVVMIFEAQSHEDRAMAGRMAVQVGMFCENFQRTSPGEPVPEVLPVVFYTDRKPWRAARSLSGAASGEAGLLTYFADSCYLLLETRVLAEGPLPEENLVSVIVKMEAARGHKELLEVLVSEREFLERRDPSLWPDYWTWAQEVLAPMRFPETEGKRFESLQEGTDMIAERIQEEREEWKREGLAEGLVKGMSEERDRGLARETGLVRGLIVRKFGDETAEKWSEREPAPDHDQLRRMGEMIIDCETGEEFLRKL